MKRIMGVSGMSLVAMLGLATAGGVAFAQAKAAAKATASASAGGDENVQYKAKTEYNFEDDNVEGDLQRPDGELINVNRKVKHSSLIEIRKDFIPEMLKSLEDV